MINLYDKNITLCLIDCTDNYDRCLNAIKFCIDKVIYTKIYFLTNKINELINYKNQIIEIVKIPTIDSLQKYSRFMMFDLNKYITTDFVQIIQRDGIIVDETKWNDEFLNYDYIGSPWWFNNEYNVGNGGFSLRSKKLLNTISDLKDKLIYFHPEDVAICRTYKQTLIKNGINFAPEEIALKYSWEENPNYKFYPDSFGIHDMRSILWLKRNGMLKDYEYTKEHKSVSFVENAIRNSTIPRHLFKNYIHS